MKKIGSCTYVHHKGIRLLSKKEKDLILKALKIIPEDIRIETTIVKVDPRNKKVTLIESKDFDTAREPEVGTAYNIDIEKCEYKTIKPRGQIYHHKWMFVPEDYKGFDIEESKKWSDLWQSIIPKDKTIKSRIGYKKYWDEYLKEYGLPVEIGL